VTRQASQASAELSQQLSGLIGRCFSHTQDGFQMEATAPDQQPSQQPSQQQQQQQPTAIRRVPRHSSDSTAEDGSYWGSPMKHDGSQAATAAAAAMAASGSHTTPAAAPVAATLPQTGGLTAFKEISRMICDAEEPSNINDDDAMLPQPTHVKTGVAAGLAARLLDEQGSWGTPQDDSPCWGTPHEQGSPGGGNTPNGGSQAEQQQQQQQQSQQLVPPHGSGQAVHKLHFGRGGSSGEQLGPSPLSAAATWAAPAHGTEERKRQAGGDADAPWLSQEDERDLLASSTQPSPFKPAAAGADDLLAIAAAAADEQQAGGQGEGAEMDFTIPVGVDVQPTRAPSRGSSRVRDLYGRVSAALRGRVVFGGCHSCTMACCCAAATVHSARRRCALCCAPACRTGARQR
jgi:hypothetical protein